MKLIVDGAQDFFCLFVPFFFISTIHTQQLSTSYTRNKTVWVSTNYRLDWPKALLDSKQQKEELIKVFSDIRKKNLNTIYFQVRSNGTVFVQFQL